VLLYLNGFNAKGIEMRQAKPGDTVRVHYAGRLESGRIFETSADCGPLQFTIGKCEVLPGFEQSVIGMSPGETKGVGIPADQAYGPYLRGKVKRIGRSQFPDEMKPEIGMHFEIGEEGGPLVIYRVIEITDTTVTLDSNHPLAGKDLIFDIKLLEIL